MKIFEEINHYKKEFVFNIYTRVKELQEIKKCLKESKYASYQEKNINNIENYIKSIIKGKM